MEKTTVFLLFQYFEDKMIISLSKVALFQQETYFYGGLALFLL